MPTGKDPGEDIFNPYSYGSSLSNCCAIVSGPLQPSLIDRRGIVGSEATAECQLLSDGKANFVTEPAALMSEIETVTMRRDNYGTTSTTGPSSVAHADLALNGHNTREDVALVEKDTEGTVRIVSSCKPHDSS